MKSASSELWQDQKELVYILWHQKICGLKCRTTSTSNSEPIQPFQMKDTAILIARTQWCRQGHEFHPWIHYGAEKIDTTIGPNGD
jgi:hypothetical protein